MHNEPIEQVVQSHNGNPAFVVNGFTLSQNIADLLDPFQTATPCWHHDSFIHVTLSYYGEDEVR
jgi:hypothetical protein